MLKKDAFSDKIRILRFLQESSPRKSYQLDRDELLINNMIILSKKFFISNSTYIISQDHNLDNLQIKVVTYKLSKNTTKNLKCPYCGAKCILFGSKSRKILNPLEGDNEQEINILPRCQCTNKDCVGKIARKNKNNVTHVVFPNTFTPYSNYTTDFIEDIGNARMLWLKAKDVNDYETSPKIEVLRTKYNKMKSNLWDWLEKYYVKVKDSSKKEKIADKFVRKANEARTVLNAILPSMLRRFYDRVGASHGGFKDLGFRDKFIAWVRDKANLKHIHQLLLNHFDREFPTYWQWFRDKIRFKMPLVLKSLS